ncbi:MULTISPECIES: hypothetical protein [Marinomonas]|uniref:Uncharacterized protein n=1 Tax=Marinomonas rhodophyticola TaxID=2992803 RepID=A0ABT3KAV6_9GAMM|nr:hypothetical protein [Marinomonas sp. KJ51-3]MCW4627671.1 hypothetical protein [Marinomonas sp. KJ51-3]
MRPIFLVVWGGLGLFMSHFTLAHQNSAGDWSSEPMNLLAMVMVAGVIIGGFIYKQCARWRKQMKKENSDHDT